MSTCKDPKALLHRGLSMARRSQYICQTCKSVAAFGQGALHRQRPEPFRLLRCSDVAIRTYSTDNPLESTRQTPHRRPIAWALPLGRSSYATVSSTDLDGELRSLLQRGTAILSSNAPPPSKEQAETLFRDCETTAKNLMSGRDGSSLTPSTRSGPSSASSALLNLEEEGGAAKPAMPVPPAARASRKKAIESLSRLVYEVIVHPAVFITPDLLQRYITIQRLLSRPRSFPEVLHLYATKPIPQPDTTPATYRTPNPDRVQFAVPKPLADTALDAAIKVKDLSLALGVIDTTYATRAFRRAKLLRKGLVPLTGLALAPVAAYSVASQLAMLQDTMEPELATVIAFAGIISYVGFTATIGIVAVTTANDQMDRVTWVAGTPLRERWLREEERAAIDRVAGAWGFKERRKRGDEEGPEWERLREWIGRGRMVLDRPELMEGME
ncbi:MAG: hypothetical protein M1816_005024 [Peltula sp. TS41687]|nr:MAG: hypothetical protein M1816_005024 [Peltula sp. TS41687]